MMAYAEFLAGMSFNNASLGYVHAMAHQLGGFYDLPHGVCNAVLLPYVQEFNMSVAESRLKKVASVMGIDVSNMTDKEGAMACIVLIKTLSKSIGIPAGLKELGVKREDFDILAANALNDACGLTNPRKATHEDVVEIFDNAF